MILKLYGTNLSKLLPAPYRNLKIYFKELIIIIIFFF